MPNLVNAYFNVHWRNAGQQKIPVQFNPKELTFEKSAQIQEIAIPGLDTPLLQFVRGQNETLTLELFFDTTEYGMDEGAVSVTTETDKIYQLVKIETGRMAPPLCEFGWNPSFPGDNISGFLGGSQARTSFMCVVESVNQVFTLFSPEGVPLRATLSVTLREYKTLDQQVTQLDLKNNGNTNDVVVQGGDTLSSIAKASRGDPAQWRQIADGNGIEDPRRLAVGQILVVSPGE